jgi:hypothetical protein
VSCEEAPAFTPGRIASRDSDAERRRIGPVGAEERLAAEPAAPGQDSVKVGRPLDREGGLREFDILGGRGFISFLPVPRHECVYVCDVTWYG